MNTPISMTQTRTMSLVESLTNVAVGYALAILTQIIVFPIFSIEVSVSQNLTIALIFTVVSVLRSYVLRRVFNRGKR